MLLDAKVVCSGDYNLWVLVYEFNADITEKVGVGVDVNPLFHVVELACTA